MNEEIKVLFLSQQKLLRESLAKTVFSSDIYLVPPVSTLEEALQSLIFHEPQVILVDLNPCMFGIRVVKEMQKVNPGCRVLILSSYPDPIAEKQLAIAGVQGFISKDIGIEALLEIIREANDGKTVFHQHGTRVSRDELLTSNCTPGITDREGQVLEMVGQGLANKEVAAALNISVKTVEKHRQRVMAKLQAHEASSLTRRAFSLGASWQELSVG